MCLAGLHHCKASLGQLQACATLALNTQAMYLSGLEQPVADFALLLCIVCCVSIHCPTPNPPTHRLSLPITHSTLPRSQATGCTPGPGPGTCTSFCHCPCATVLGPEGAGPLGIGGLTGGGMLCCRARLASASPVLLLLLGGAGRLAASEGKCVPAWEGSIDA